MVTEATRCWTLTTLCPEIPRDLKKQEDAEAKAVQCLGEGAGAEEEGELELLLFLCVCLFVLGGEFFFNTVSRFKTPVVTAVTEIFHMHIFSIWTV